MSDTIRTILAELYELEPELKKHEAELAPLILKLIKAKPEIKPSASLVAALKIQLEEKEKELMSNSPTETDKITIITKLFSFMRLPYLVAGAAVIMFALILVSSLPGALRRSAPSNQFVSSITKVEPGAFGSLLASADSNAAPVGLGSGSNTAAAPMMATSESNISVSADDTVSAKMAAPAVGLGGGQGITRPYYAPSYTYNYVGEELNDLPDQVEVLRRVKNVGFPLSTSFFKSFDVGNFKLDSFTNTSLANVTLTEEKEFGHIITIDFNEGLVSVYENWRRWPNPYNNCQDEACYQSLRLSVNDLPSDDEVIALANDWLILRNINPSDYGKPYVQNDWRLYYQADSPEQSATYVPDVLTVIYPLLVNNTNVYENGGSPAGVGVNVNVRYKKVSGLWNLLSQQYQASAYTAESDFKTILQYLTNLNQGGYPMPLIYPMPPIDSSPTAETLELGTPVIGYMKHWTYQNNESQELLLPSLIFPVLNLPTQANYYSAKQVVVPLVKEYWQNQTPMIDGPIKIMPAVEPGAGVSSGSAGSAEVMPTPEVVEPEPAVLPD